MSETIKVLLIDDSHIALETVQAVLVSSGFDVRATYTLEHFDEVLGDWTPDLILSDVDMPGMSGPELCKTLKSRYETMHVPIVLFSALSEQELDALATECEADGYLSKRDGIDRLSDELRLLYQTLSW